MCGEPGGPDVQTAVSPFRGSQIVAGSGVCQSATDAAPGVSPVPYDPASEIPCPAPDLGQSHACKRSSFGEQPRGDEPPSDSVSTHLSMASNECRSTVDGDVLDDVASTSASSSESGTLSGPSSGVATPPPPEVRQSATVPVSEEDVPDSLAAGLTTEQLWKFVAHVTNKSTGPASQEQSLLPQQSQETARLAFASASASLNAAASAYHGVSTRAATARNAQVQSRTNGLFDSALLDSTVARPRTRGLGLRRQRQQQPQVTNNCYARHYPPRLPPSPCMPGCPPDLSTVGPVTRSGAKRTAATARSPQCQDVSCTPPLKRRRGSIEKDQAASRPPSRNLSTLFGLLGKSLEEGSAIDDKGEALDCEFWREFKKAMVLVAYLDKVKKLSCGKYRSPPAFLCRMQVVCSACCSCPALNGRRSSKKRSDPTRPGRPAPEPRCVPKYINIPSWVYNQPIYRRVLYKWHARQNGTEPISTREFQCATRELSPRTLGDGVFFSSRVTDELRSKEAPRFYFSGFVPSLQQKVDGALSEAECAPASVDEKASVSTQHGEERRTTKVQGGISYDDREDCWYAKMKGGNHVITKRFSAGRPNLLVRQPDDILAGATPSDGGPAASPSSSEQASSSASLYYEWVSKHFQQVSSFLGTKESVGPDTSSFCALQARKALLQSGNMPSAANSKARSRTTSSFSPSVECTPCAVSSSGSRPTRVHQQSTTHTGLALRQPASRRQASSRSRSRPPVPQSQLVTSQHAICQGSPYPENEQTILKQCQLLLSKHRQHLSEHLSTREIQSDSLESFQHDATAAGPASPQSTEQQIHKRIFTQEGIAKLQDLVRSTLGMLPDPHLGAFNNGQELRLLQQMRQYHMDMQRLVMNSAAKQSITAEAVL